MKDEKGTYDKFCISSSVSSVYNLICSKELHTHNNDYSLLPTEQVVLME